MRPEDAGASVGPDPGAWPGAGSAPPSGGSAFRPFASLGRGLAGNGARALLAGLGHLLRQNEWARAKLSMFSGRRVRIGIDAPSLGSLPPPRLTARITDDGLLEVLHIGVDEPVDAQLLVRPTINGAFALMRQGARGLSPNLRIEGDVMLAAALTEIIDQLRWDAEEDLSRFTGDVVARRVGRAVESARATLTDLRSRFESATGVHLSGNSGQLVGRGELSAMRSSIDALDARLARLDERVGERSVPGSGSAGAASADPAIVPQLQPPLELPRLEFDPEGPEAPLRPGEPG